MYAPPGLVRFTRSGITYCSQISFDRRLSDWKKPFGSDMSVTSRVRYSAASSKDGKTVFDDTVAATGTGKFGDALIGVERLRLANEASVRANIESFIQRFRDALGAAKPSGEAPPAN